MSGTAKLSAKDRILTLLDDNSFVEIGALVTKRNTDFNMQQMSAPGDGIVTGYGVINENLVYVYSQDASALSGTIGEMHAKKIVNLYRLAMKTGAPVIGLIDCAGIRLQEASDALAAFGRLFKAEAMASGVIPQITAVFGDCGGGLAVLAEMSDFVFMAKDAKLFVTAPNAIAGNNAGKLDTASAAYMETSGAVDFVGEDEVAVLNRVRDLVDILPANNEDECIMQCEDDLNRATGLYDDEVADPAAAFSDISDNGTFVEVKSGYAPEMVTGFIKLNGATVGAIGNRTALVNGKDKKKFDAVLTSAGCYKAAAFVNYCDAFGIPVLTFSNVAGYSKNASDAKSIATASAKMAFAFAGATVPKVNLVTGKSYGTAYAAFNSKSLGADMEYALEGTEIGTMDAKLAAQIVYAGEVGTEEALNAKAAEYQKEANSAENAARRGYVDAIISASEVRAQIIYAFEMLSTKKELRPAKKHGTV